MVSDDERREVARMLRELPGDSTYPDLIGVIADHDGWYPAADAADRLADLIEPSDHIGDSDKMVDREALLALADECDMMRDDGLPIGSYEIYRIAHRIREALGVQDA